MHGVGVIGAGPGVSALHLPTLGQLVDDFEVVHIADAGSGRARLLAERVGARCSTGVDALLGDPRVDIVAVCGPPHTHAEHVLAAVAAGKRAIFCEKPLGATRDEIAAVITACQDAGVRLVVGTNHLFDPAWGRAKHHLLARAERIRSITITVALPPNDRYHELVSESEAQLASAPRRAPDWSDPDVASAVVRQLVLGLAIHDLPLVRDLAPESTRVVFARPIDPIGYLIGFRAGDVLLQIVATMLPGGADALWRISVSTTGDQVDISFPPAFVHAGSASVSVHGPSGMLATYPPQEQDGYLEEWRALALLLRDEVAQEHHEILADAEYAIALASDAARAVRDWCAR